MSKQAKTKSKTEVVEEAMKKVDKVKTDAKSAYDKAIESLVIVRN